MNVLASLLRITGGLWPRDRAQRRSLLLEFLEDRIAPSVDLRIATYNITGDARTGMGTVLRAMGDQVVNGVSRPVDVLALQETDSQATDTQAIVNLLNGIYGANTYARGNLNGSSTGAGTQGVVYRTSTVQLLSETAVSAGTGPRQPLRYQFRPVGFGTTNDFYMYVVHPKASTGSANVAQRNSEAQQVRANADALPQGTNILYVGDTNFYTSSESGWATLTAAGNGQLTDPINQVGNWTNNVSFAAVHTQSPTTTQRFSGQITGGMDDRFDMQLVSGELLDGSGLDIIAGSYRVLGNNGSTFNQDIDSPNNTWVWSPVAGSTVTRSALLTTLASITDHLPVIADYDIIGAGDTTPPTIGPTNFVDNVSGGPVGVNQTVTYTLTFSEDIANTSPGTLEAADLENVGTSAITLGTITETSAGVFTVQVTPTTAGTLNLRLRSTATVTDVAGNALTSLPIADNTTITVTAGDTTSPTVVSIDDGDADNLVPANVAMTYTVTFSEDIISTGGGAFTAADLNNAGTASITIGAITETGSGVFTVRVTPTTAGTIILRIPTGAAVTDLAGNALVVPVQDNDTVTADATAPTITGANFVDNVSGGPVFVNQTVTYTVTFSEDILNGSLTAADLDNAGTAGISIGTITETSPGVFTVQVTPTTSGTLVLRFPTGAVVQDVAGNPLVVPVQDNTTITVNPALSTFTVNSTAVLDGGIGFLVTFSAPYDVSALNLYTNDTGNTLDARDVQVSGPGGINFGVDNDEIRFSAVPVSDTQLALVLSGPNRVAAAGLLPAGSYTVTLQGGSGSAAFKRLSDSAPLDGNSSNSVVADDDYVSPSLAVSEVAANVSVFSVADVVAGPGQTMNVPLVASNDVNDLRSVSLTIAADPTYAEFIGFALSPTIPGGSATFNTDTGVLSVTATSAFAATDAPFLVGTFQLRVPGLGNLGTAPALGNKALLDLTVTSATNAASQPKPFLADDGLHAVAYLGDMATATGAYSGNDVANLQSYVVGFSSAFALCPNLDPSLIADVNKDGSVNGNDIAELQARVVGFPSVLPALPSGSTGGPDPILFLGTAFTEDNRPADLGSLRPGQTIVLPVSVKVTEPDGVSVAGADVALRFDPAVLEFRGVTAGSVADGSLGGAAFAIGAREVAPGVVRISGNGTQGPALAFGQTATVYLVTLQARSNAAAGTAELNLLASWGNFQTGLTDNLGRTLVLIPAPSDGAGDDVDGRVEVLAGGTRGFGRGHGSRGLSDWVDALFSDWGEGDTHSRAPAWLAALAHTPASRNYPAAHSVQDRGMGKQRRDTTGT